MRQPFRLNTVKWRMPFSYAVIALITAFTLGSIMLLVLNSYYVNLEQVYLSNNISSLQPITESLLQADMEPSEISQQLRNLSFFYHVQIKIFDQNKEIIADSGLPFSVYKISVEKNVNEDINDDQYTLPPEESTSNSVNIGGVLHGDNQYTMPPSENSTFNPVTIEKAINGDIVVLEMLQSEQAAHESNIGFVFLERKEQSNSIFVTIAETSDSVTSINSGASDVYISPNILISSQIRASSQTFTQPIAQNKYYLELSNGPAYGYEILSSVAIAWLAAAILSCIVAIISGLVISRQVTHPVLHLIDATENMQHGDLSTRVNQVSAKMDEFNQLAGSFNTMAERIDKTISTLRTFVSDAAHEINTPLTAIKINLELAENENNLEKKEYYIKNAYQNCMRLEQLSDNLLDLSRIENNHILEKKRLLSLEKLLREISELYASQAEQKNIEFNFLTPAKEISLLVNEQQLTQAISNLLENALKFTPEDGTVELSLLHENDFAIIQICDTGIGIPEEDLPHLFERFHRGRNANQYPGNGLGLAIVKAIVDAHNGEVKAIPAENGCCFQIRLPINN